MPKRWPNTLFFLSFLALILAVVATSPASRAAGASAGGASSQELAAQRRPHIIIRPRRFYAPGPSAKRYCRSWLQVQHRPSGTVIVPQMVCWWG